METEKESQTQDYGMRIYDLRLGRFLSVDPISDDFPELTPFQFASNTPIQAIDLDGLEKYYTADGKLIGKIGTSTQIRIVNNKKVKAITSYIKWNNFTNSEKYASIAKGEAYKLSHEVKTSPEAKPKSKPKSLSNSSLDKAGLELSGEISLGGLGGGEIEAQAYGRSETDMSGKVELNIIGNQATGSEEAKTYSLQGFIGLNFDFSGDNQDDYNVKILDGKTLSIEPYLRCSTGPFAAEFNMATNELKIGIGLKMGGPPCELGVKEKVTMLQITNDPILKKDEN